MANNLAYNQRGGSMTFGKAGFAEGTNAGTIKTTAAVDYSVDGILYTKAITDNIAVTANDEQAADTTCLYLFSIDSAGTVTTTKGTEVLSADLTTAVDTLTWPSLPANSAAVGAVKVVTVAVTFTAGTTDLGAAGVTDTYYDLATVPAANL